MKKLLKRRKRSSYNGETNATNDSIKEEISYRRNPKYYENLKKNQKEESILGKKVGNDKMCLFH